MKDLEEPFRLAQRLAAQQFGDAPRELLLTIDLAMSYLKQNKIREAWLELNRAHRLVRDQNLDEWRAEMAAAWAVYHYHKGDQAMMYQSIRLALRLEPENKRIAALKRALETDR